jgi:methylase of polypeptide subunit release factors
MQESYVQRQPRGIPDSLRLKERRPDRAAQAKKEAQLSLFDDEGLLLTEAALVRAVVALGPHAVGDVSRLEQRLIASKANVREFPRKLVADLRRRIRAGEDPLGDSFVRIRSPADRRPLGATYTPQSIVTLMLDWASEQSAGKRPVRVIDPGVGSARFLLEAGRRFPRARLIGVEIDPLAALIARANLATHGMAGRARIVLSDYRAITLPTVNGRSLFIGNPPYVRHHLIDATWKDWLVEKAASLDLSASQLAGLHVHFFLATALASKADDLGVFITAAEWLDVNYGRLVRDLFLGPLGGQDLLVLEPTVRAFADAATTAAITTFSIGNTPASISLNRVDSIDDVERIGHGRLVHRDRLAAESRWSHLSRPTRQVRANYVELGEVCRVHRGSVTGANKTWIAGDHSADLPDSVLFPTVTKARELIAAGEVLSSANRLRRVIDLPVDLDGFGPDDRRAIERFLRKAREQGAHTGYIARHRKAWWSVGLREPPPIMATYMARRAPAFVRNRAEARYINIAHGLYPRERLSEKSMVNLVRYLSGAICVSEGRTYAGGLTKFEPREMERILVPAPDLLAAGEF